MLKWGTIAAALALMAPGAVAAPDCRNCPEKLAFYYGWPSIVNGANTDTTLATAAFARYDIVVFGDGLEEVTHEDHDRTATIIRNLRASRTRVCGYIDLSVSVSNLSLGEIARRTDLWAGMGVAGIFLDLAGYDWGVPRARLNAAVDTVHRKGLSAFINAWDPDDVFSPQVQPTYNLSGARTHLGPIDYLLLESFAVELSEYQDPGFLIAKADKARNWHKRYGTRMATVNTVAQSNPPFDEGQFDYVWWMTLLYDFDAMAWGETWTYSSDSQMLPFHPRPEPGRIGDSVWPFAVEHYGSVHKRRTTTGIVEVNTLTHVGEFLPYIRH